MGEMKDEGYAFTKYDVGEAGDFITEDKKTYVIVPATLEMSMPKAKVITKTYLLGISPDGGQNMVVSGRCRTGRRERPGESAPQVACKTCVPEN